MKNKDLINYLIEEIKIKKNLANSKAIMSLKDAIENGEDFDFEHLPKKVDKKELFYYLGYRQAARDILNGLQGQPYIFTEYEESNLLIEDPSTY